MRVPTALRQAIDRVLPVSDQQHHVGRARLWVEPLHRPGEGPRLGLDAGIEERDLLVQQLDVAQQPLEHERVVVGDAPDQRLPQLRLLLAQDSPRQCGQVLGIAFPRDERLEHRPPGGAEHIGGDGGERDGGRLQDLLDSIGVPGAVLDQLPAEAGQLAQFADGRRRHETRPEPAMLQQPPDPLAILDVGLPPGHRLDVLGVDEEELKAALQHLVDGPPVDPGALHRDVGAAGRGQPVGEDTGGVR
jgi:hypothetical protein